MMNAERRMPLRAIAAPIIFGLIPRLGVAAVSPLRISGMQTTTTNVNTIAMISAERPMRYDRQTK